MYCYCFPIINDCVILYTLNEEYILCCLPSLLAHNPLGVKVDSRVPSYYLHVHLFFYLRLLVLNPFSLNAQSFLNSRFFYLFFLF